MSMKAFSQPVLIKKNEEKNEKSLSPVIQVSNSHKKI